MTPIDEDSKNDSSKNRKQSKLKGLYAQKIKLQEKLIQLNKDKGTIEKHIKNTTTKLLGLQKGITHLENREILITTHFIARYIQRIGPATEDEMRAHIITAQLENMINTLGNGTYPVGEYMVRVEDRKLITIMISDNKK